MSWEALSWASKIKTGKQTRKHVLMTLSNRHNHDTGLCCPREDLIAAECELSVRAVRQAIRDLEEMGILSTERKRHGSLWATNHYVLNLHRQDLPVIETSPAAAAAVSPAVDDRITGTTCRLTRSTTRIQSETTSHSAARTSRNGNGNGNGHVTKSRKPDPLWDVFDAEFGTVATRAERGRRNAALKQLREVGATPEQLRGAINHARSLWSLEVTITESAIAANWSKLTSNGSGKTGESLTDLFLAREAAQSRGDEAEVIRLDGLLESFRVEEPRRPREFSLIEAISNGTFKEMP